LLKTWNADVLSRKKQRRRERGEKGGEERGRRAEEKEHFVLQSGSTQCDSSTTREMILVRVSLME
jgi:hypothetical protein